MPVTRPDWAGAQQAMLDFVASSVPPDVTVHWRDDSVPHANPRAVADVLLNIESIEPQGTQVARYGGPTGDPGATLIVPYIQQISRVVLSLTCEAGEHVPGVLAEQVLAELEMRTDLPGVRDSLDDQCLSLASTGIINTANITTDRWTISAATTEWVWYVSTIYQDTDVTVEVVESVDSSADGITI
jgi:hypothetical protein